MSNSILKNDLAKWRKKSSNSFIALNIKKPLSFIKYRNQKLFNKRGASSKKNKTINNSLINNTISNDIIGKNLKNNSSKNKNKNKLNIPIIIKKGSLGNIKKNSIINKNSKLNKIKSLNKNFINSNYFDINNNNYFVNLYNNLTTPKSIKIKEKNNTNTNTNTNKKFNSKENKILLNERKYFNLESIKKRYNFNNKGSSKKAKTISYLDTSTMEKMKNYRNKLLLEFMKYIDKFLFLYKKRHFLLLTKNINIIKEKKLLHKCIYKKKIYKIPCRNSISKFYTFNTSLQKMKIKVINKNKNIANLNISGIKGKNLIKKIINNQSKDVLDGEIRNIFIDSNFPFKNKNLNNKSNTIYTSYKGKKNKFNLDSYNDREIEIKFKNVDYLNKEINKSPNKINLRSNSFSYNIWKKNVNKKYMKLTMQRAINEYYVINKRYIDNENQNKNLASITEEDEKIFISNQDLSGINNEIKKI